MFMPCRYDNEITFYNAVLDHRSQGYPFFPSVLAFGEIIISAICHAGYILILSKVEGELLAYISGNLNDLEWHIVREQY